MKKLHFYLALTALFIIIAGSVLAPCLATHNPFEPQIMQRLQTPSAEHWLGTDQLGRDLYSRILYGGRASILLSVLSSALALAAGITIGTLSGYYGGKLDVFLTIIGNIFQGIPGSCFMIAIAGILGPSIYSLVLALVIVSWASFSRIVRAQVISLREEDFMDGLRCLGCSDFYLLTRHILPHIYRRLLILFTIRFGRGILAIAGLSFLGLGVQPPTPDWSVMINDAVLYYRSYPHLLLVPGAFIFTLIYSINTIGDYLRDSLDVRQEDMRSW